MYLLAIKAPAKAPAKGGKLAAGGQAGGLVGGVVGSRFTQTRWTTGAGVATGRAESTSWLTSSSHPRQRWGVE